MNRYMKPIWVGYGGQEQEERDGGRAYWATLSNKDSGVHGAELKMEIQRINLVHLKIGVSRYCSIVLEQIHSFVLTFTFIKESMGSIFNVFNNISLSSQS